MSLELKKINKKFSTQTNILVSSKTGKDNDKIVSLSIMSTNLFLQVKKINKDKKIRYLLTNINLAHYQVFFF